MEMIDPHIHVDHVSLRDLELMATAGITYLLPSRESRDQLSNHTRLLRTVNEV